MNGANTRRLLCGILYAVALCGAQAPEGVHDLGGGVSPPRIRFKVEPEYSKEARAALLAGTVLLQVIVGTDGKARDFKVLRSIGLGLDENAIAAVSRWEFEPGTKGGQPVNVQAKIQVNFRLGNTKGITWHLGRVVFQLPQGASRPVIEKTSRPHTADGTLGATATLTFDIDESGTPKNIQIEKGSAEDWANDVTAVLRKWRFTPASKDGAPVSVPCTMDFVRGN
jgi:TonB family protein